MKQTPEGAFDPLLPVYRKPEDMGGLRGRVHLRLMLMPLAFLAFGIAARGDHQPPQVTTGSAAPLPMEVLLGSSGETATLMTTAGGEFMLNGEAFASGGSVTAGNGGRYTLRLADGTWTAQFDAHEIVVRLGTSGETVTITQAEDGTYRLGDLAVQSGETVHTAANGNEYVLRITTDNSGAITWTATYRAPVIKVLLGTSGDTVRLDKAEDGSHRLGELAITSGATTIMAGNGNTYTLTLGEDGTWMAEYREMVVDVLLGTSGETVVVRKAEDGSYWLGELAVESGVTLTTASNGNQFRLRLGEDGTWRAEYVPMGGTVTVGSLGVTLEAMRTEDGTWTVVSPVSGEPETLVDGTTFMFGGNTYTLSSDGEGNWMAEYREMVVDVLLGMSAEMVQLRRAEDGSYWLDDRQVEDGVTMVTAGNGNVYTLALGEDGMWTALHAAPEATVKLGRSETTVTIVQAEDGTYTLNGEAFSSGSRVTAGNGNVYTVTLADGGWTAEHVPETVEIKGTDGLLAVLRENRRAYSVDGATLDLSGRGVITTQNSGIYRVRMQDGMLIGARMDRVNIGEATRFKVDLRDQPKILEDDPDTPDVKEAQTALVVADEIYPFADLLAGGVSQMRGKNFVADARMRLMEIRENIKIVLEVFDTDSDRDTQVQRQWGTASANNAKTNVKGVLRSVFGSRKFGSLTAPDDDSALGKIDNLIKALSSADELATALGDDGVLEDAEADVDDAVKIFAATETESTMTYGMYGKTRFGTIARKRRGDAVSDTKYDADADPKIGERGAFAFGITKATGRERYVQTAGTARYEGQTLAVSGAETHYAGDIEISVNFNSKQVDGLITNLQTADGRRWEYGFGNEVNSIVLPTAVMNWAGTWTQGSDDNRNEALVGFGRHAGAHHSQMVKGTFRGRLLGGDMAPSAGSEAVGVWSVGVDTESSSYLAAGFGAGRIADEPVVRPSVDDGTEVNSTLSGPNAGLANGELMVTVPSWGFFATGSEGRGVWQQAPSDALTPKLDVSISLSTLLRSEGSEYNLDGERHVKFASDEITKLRDNIAAKQEIGGLGDSVRRDWLMAQYVLLYSVFHDSRTKADDAFQAELPGQVNDDGTARRKVPTNVLDRLDRIIVTLRSEDGLEAAFDPDKDGIFTVVDGNEQKSFLDVHVGKDKRISTAGASAPPPAKMFNNRRWQFKSTVGTTDYTRFGVWRIQHSKNALLADDWQKTAKGSFSYSPLIEAIAPTKAALPDGGEAIYKGKTVAYVGTTAYEGEVQVEVRWFQGGRRGYDSELTLTRNREIGGNVTTVISDLRRVDTGDYLFHAGNSVHSLVFGRIVFATKDSKTGDGDHRLNFHSSETFGTEGKIVRTPANNRQKRQNYLALRRKTQINYRDVSLSRPQPANLDHHSFTFIGTSADGPQGVIGRYELGEHRNNKFGVNAKQTNAKIIGAYGADLAYEADLP